MEQEHLNWSSPLIIPSEGQPSATELACAELLRLLRRPAMEFYDGSGTPDFSWLCQLAPKGREIG
jgi:hypothetical protein